MPGELEQTSEAFQRAADEVKQFTTRPSDEELLSLYGLYKQAVIGDNTTTKPGVFAFKDRAKWDAWTHWKGTSKEAAEEEYIKLVKELKMRTKGNSEGGSTGKEGSD